MLNEIKIDGLKFWIEGHDFVRAKGENDFETITAIVEAHLSALEAAELSRLHAGAIFGDDGPADQAAFDDLNRIAASASSEVTKDWHDGSGVFVTISAWPTDEQVNNLHL
jgi:hypothetical protein